MNNVKPAFTRFTNLQRQRERSNSLALFLSKGDSGPRWSKIGSSQTHAVPRSISTLTIYATHGGVGENRRIAKVITSGCVGSAADPLTAPCSTLKAVEINSDHSFADSRLALIDEVVGWLAKISH